MITTAETVKNDEKNMIADSILCNNPVIDKCCVCYDVNSIYTTCQHNLCRICFYKILIIKDVLYVENLSKKN
jgi:hypothetical protein